MMTKFYPEQLGRWLCHLQKWASHPGEQIWDMKGSIVLSQLCETSKWRHQVSNWLAVSGVQGRCLGWRYLFVSHRHWWVYHLCLRREERCSNTEPWDLRHSEKEIKGEGRKASEVKRKPGYNVTEAWITSVSRTRQVSSKLNATQRLSKMRKENQLLDLASQPW